MRRAFALLSLLALVLAAFVPAAAARGTGPTIENDIVVESKDGTPIVATLMLPEGASANDPVPAILRTHGWGGNRDEEPSGIIERFLEEGYAVLTWDSRGFGESGGAAHVGSPGFEVDDAKALISYLATRDEIQVDGPGDPRVGWTGLSNAAGVQLNTAALDDRIEAIVPEISWGDLLQDLVPNAVAKQSWDELLYFFGAVGATAEGVTSPAGPQTGVYANEIHQGHAEITTTGQNSEGIKEWFAFRSTTTRSADIETPTFILQGTVDTLFPIQDAFDNYANLTAAGTPVKVMTYCSGHTIGCPYPGGASGHPEGGDDKTPIFEDRILAWLDRYVKGTDVDTGAEIEWQAQDGRYYPARKYPLPGTKLETTKTVETGALFGPGPGGGDGILDGNPAPSYELGRSAARPEIFGPLDKRVALLGVPEVELKGSVTGLTAFAFFELVDVSPDGERVTVDDQTMPIRLGSGDVKETLALNGISWILEPGHKLELEITTGSTQYQAPRTGPFEISLQATTTLPVTNALPAPVKQ